MEVAPYENAVVSVQARDGRWFALEIHSKLLPFVVGEALDHLCEHNSPQPGDRYGIGDSSIQAHLELLTRRPLISTGRRKEGI